MDKALLEKQMNLASKKSIKFIFRLVLFCFMLCNSAVAQVTNYQLDQLQITPAFTLLPAAPTSTNLFTTSSNVDNGVATVTIPFTFQFNGASYTSVNVSLHGFLTFGTAPALTEVSPISSTVGYSGVISAFGMDLDLVPGSLTRNVAHYTSGTPGSRIFKVQWNVRRSNGASSIANSGTNDNLFQIWLYETTNVIEMHYEVNNGGGTFNAYGQIGLRGAANTDFKNLNYSSPAANWPGVAPSPVGTMPLGTANTQLVLIRNTAQLLASANRLFRWTPVTCFAPTGLAVTGGSITSTAATITWNAAVPAPANGYDYYVTTSPVAPNAGTTPTGSTLAGVLTANLTGLTQGQLHYVYVRSKCSGVDISTWSSVLNFTTLCNPVGVPYFQPFDGPIIPVAAPNHGVLPTCTSQQNVGSGNSWVTTNQDLYYSNASMDANILMYNGQSPGNSNPADVWWFTEGINLVGGTTYTVNYTYGGTSTPSTVQNKMRVAYGTYPSFAAMTNPLDNHPDIKSSPFINLVNFTPASTGVYYFGFNAYSNPNNGQLYVDDVQVYESVCFKPTAVSVSGVTSSTALLSWTPPTPAPSAGYAYYFSTSSLPPTNSTAPSGFTAAGVNSVLLSGLSGSTNYYFWVRSNCGFGEFGEWVALNNSGNPFFTTLLAPPAYCIPTGSSGGLTYINNFTTTGGVANINNSSGYSASGYGSYVSQLVSQSPGNSVNFSVGIFGPTVGVAIWVDWNNNGTFEAAERVFNTTTYVSAASGTFAVPGGQPLGSYRMRVFIDYLASNPANPCVFVSARSEAEDYTFNVLTPPPPITININSSVQCQGVSSPTINLTTPLANFDNYSWFPSTGVTGNASTGWTISSNSTITYILTGTQTTSPFSTNSVSFTYTANPIPTPITITAPSGTEVCPVPSPAIPLLASGGIVSGIAILNETFNTGAPGWTNTNTSTGGNVAAPTWTIRASGYNPAGGTGISSVVSNDNSSFYLSNSDAQGSGSTTNVELISPVFSLGGYTSAALSFYHFVKFYQAINNPYARVMLSTDGGTTYPVTLQQWLGTTLGEELPVGATPTNFSNTIIDLTPYVGQTNLRVKFSYYDRWGYIWAIDNFLVSGSASTNIRWNTQTAPVANGVAVPGLYTNAAATTQYIAGNTTTTVYALPTVATTYTASASTPAPVCVTTSSVSVTVNAIVAGTASSNQTICSGAPADLTLTGFTGTVSNWQSADNAAFTLGVATIPLSNSATLTSAQMGGLLSTKYFRATITNGICTAYSNVVTISVGSITTYSGGTWDNGLPNASTIAVFNDDYVSSGNITACGVLITAGDVLFNSGDSLIVTNAVNTTGGSLTFDNTASLVQINNVSNVGNITYVRNSTPMRRYDFTYWSSPVAPQTLFAFSPLTLSDKYFVFDQVINNWQNVSSSNLMSPGKGYIIRAPQTHDINIPSIFSGSFIGVPNNGTISTNIVVGSGTINLIGNPYPSAIDADLFLSDSVNDPILGGAIYLWTHNTPITANLYTFNDYAIYTLAGGVGTNNAINSGTGNNTVPNGYIAAGEGFMIEGSIPSSTNSVFFRNSMRVVGNNNQFFRLGSEDRNSNSTSSIEKHRVWLEVFNNEGAYKQILVGYIENATNDYEKYDGKVFDLGNPVFLYTMVDDEKLGIQARSLPFDVNDTVPLGFKSALNGNFEIKLSDFDGLFENQNVYIEDLYLNVIHDLKSGNYSFTTTIGTFENRFVLRYTNSTLSTNQNTFTDNSVFIYKENKDIVINSANVSIDNVEIHDIRGRLLYSKKDINSTQFLISNLNSSRQVLIVTVTSSDGRKVTKKIIY